jgi:hypothetical protein
MKKADIAYDNFCKHARQIRIQVRSVADQNVFFLSGAHFLNYLDPHHALNF